MRWVLLDKIFHPLESMTKICLYVIASKFTEVAISANLKWNDNILEYEESQKAELL